MTKKRVSQKEIASRAGLSQSAVSSFFSNPETTSVSQEKKDVLFDLIRRNNWELSPAKNPGIGFLVGEKMLNPGYALSDFYNHFYNGVIDRCDGERRKVVIYRNIDGWDKFLKHSCHEVNGLIVLRKVDSELVRQMIGYHPVALLNQETDEFACDTVMPDNKGGMEAVVWHLADKGHCRIAFFGFSPPGGEHEEDVHFRQRMGGFCEAMRKRSLPVPDDWMSVYEAEKHTYDEIRESACSAIKSWEGSGSLPTAVVTPGDVYAVYFMKAAAEMGYRIPGDFSVTGFDNRSLCDFATPALTSVDCGPEEMAKEAAALLSRRLRGDGSRIKKVICSVKIVERESVKKIRGKGVTQAGVFAVPRKTAARDDF